MMGVLSGICLLPSPGTGISGLPFILPAKVVWGDEPTNLKPRAPLRFRSDLYLLKVAREDFRLQHDQMARKALNDLLSSHPRSILKGPALLLLARISAIETIQSKNRDFRAPLKLFRQAEAVLPSGWDKGEVRYRMGQYLIRQRFGVEGRGLLDQVVSRFPEGPWVFRAKLLMADSLREEGHLVQAEKILKEIGPQSPLSSKRLPRTKEETLRYDYAMGHLLMDEGRPGEAQGLYIKALNLSSAYPYKHPEVLILLGRYAYSMEHNRRAARLFRTLLHLYPDDGRTSEAEYYMARIAGRMGPASHERARLRAVIADNPGTTGSHLAQLQLIRMTFISGKNSPASLPEVRDKAIDRLAQLESEERNVRIAGEAALLRIRLLDMEGRSEEALRILSRLEGDTDLSGSFGRRLLAMEQRILLEKILSLSHPLKASRTLAFYRSYRYRLPSLSSPGGGNLALLLARAQWKKGAPDKAFENLDRALENIHDKKSRREASFLRFDWLESSRGEKSALEWARINLSDRSLSDGDRALWFSRAIALTRKSRQTSMERTLLEQWLKSGVHVEHTTRLKARLGLLDLAAGKEEEGEKALVRVLPSLRDRSGDKALLSDALFHLGQLSWSRGDLTRGEAYWKELLECCPSDRRRPWVLYQMGNMALGRGDRTDALDFFKRAEKASGGKEIGKVARLKIESMGLENNGGKQ